MADFGSPIAQTVNPVGQGIQTLSGLLGVKQQQQALQTGQFLQQSAQAQAQQQQQTAQQRQAQARVWSQFDVSKHLGSDGTLDLNQVLTDPQLRAAAGDQFPEIAQQMQDIKQKQLTAKNTLADVNSKVLDQFRQGIGGLANDPDVKAGNNTGKGKVQDFIQTFGQGGDDNARIAQQYSGPLSNAPPNRLPDVLKTIELQGQSAAEQLKTVTPQATPIQTTGGVQMVNVNPNAPQAVGSSMGAPVANTPPPSIVTFPNSQLGIMGGPYGDGRGGQQPPPQAPSLRRPDGNPKTAADDAPSPNAPRAQQDAYNTAVQGTNAHVDSVRTADESYGNNMTIANTIRQLSKNADTGPGTETWNKVMGVLGTPKANNYQELNAFLNRQAASIRGQMGLPGTNAGAEDSKMIAGNTGYNAKVIQDKNDYTQALTEGLHQYRNGLDRVAGFSGQASPSAVNAYKSAWANNFDPDVYRGELAYRRSKADGDTFVKSLPPAEAASLQAKRKALQALSQGQLPQ